MGVFVILYFAFLVIASCLAVYFEKRGPFLTIFSLLLVSFVLGIVGGAGALRFIAIGAGVLAFAAGRHRDGWALGDTLGNFLERAGRLRERAGFR